MTVCVLCYEKMALIRQPPSNDYCTDCKKFFTDFKEMLTDKTEQVRSVAVVYLAFSLFFVSRTVRYELSFILHVWHACVFNKPVLPQCVNGYYK